MDTTSHEVAFEKNHALHGAILGAGAGIISAVLFKTDLPTSILVAGAVTTVATPAMYTFGHPPIPNPFKKHEERKL